MFTIFPELVRCARAYDEERLALLAHRYFGSGEPLKTRTQYEEMLTKAGIILCYETSLDSYGTLLIRDERVPMSPVICVRKDLDWMEQKFLIAMFLGRFLFDHQVKIVSRSSKLLSIREIQSPYLRFLLSKRPRHSQLSMLGSRMEWLSDEFAGAFLLPKQWLRTFVEEEKDPLRIAAHFSVSLDFLHARIKHIRQKFQGTLYNSHHKGHHANSPLARIRDHARKIDPSP